ncbi:MAG: class I SAM-dependent methyltransferase [Tannerellaceae bacterium]|jgi:hypothetical protein|nr:class I SAM-dependent methyltransferase [Tannerellaceae bacterium]
MGTTFNQGSSANYTNDNRQQTADALFTENNITTSDNNIIDISDLSINELWHLQYEQEKSFANLIKKADPFSLERGILMKNGYETINKLMKMRSSKEGKILSSYGASDSYGKLVEKIVRKSLRKKSECLFFEAGVGTGKIITAIANIKNVCAIGCDVYVDRDFIRSDLTVYECTIYEALEKLEDNSIDVFYWNDVMEHIPEDEIESYIEILASKMNIGGVIITITPNRLKGPCDITSHFEPHGTIAKGFHFHEYTFYEIITLFKKYDIKSSYGFLGYARKGWYILGSSKVIDKIKFVLEKAIAKFPYLLRKILITIMGCDVSILKK